MRTKIGSYELKNVNRKRKDWRRTALTELGLLANLMISGFYLPVFGGVDSEYGICAILGSASVMSLVCCSGLYFIRKSPLRESFWVTKIPVIIAEFSIPFLAFYLIFAFFTGDFELWGLGALVLIYALPFVFESTLPRPVVVSETLDLSDLGDSWSRCWQGIGAQHNGDELKHALITAWNEPQRKYHTEQHLRECLTLFEEFQHLAEHPHEVELAIWFHDAIYDIKGKDNERKSADWARSALTSAGVSDEKCQRIYELIMATEHSAMDALDTADKQLLVDIDLAILGSSPARFAEYEQQVRAEYSYVPGFIFRRKRRQILTSFLNRNPIYGTSDLKLRFELQARRNLNG